jgi:hypothetical protein
VHGVIKDWQGYVKEQAQMLGVEDNMWVNIDETNVDYDVKSSSTLERVGSRSVALKTTGSSSRATVLLGVSKAGDKLKPYIIFKGVPGGRINRE